MILNSVEDFEREFPDELSCIKYMWAIRAKVPLGCSYCGTLKMWDQRDGKIKRCSNKPCGAPNTVTSGSFISGTKLKMKDWLYLFFMHIKTRGRFSSLSHGLNFSNAYGTDEKIKKVFELISKGDFPNDWFLEQSVFRIFVLKKEDALQYRKENIFSGGLLINPLEIIDLSNEEVYKRAKLFCAITINRSLKNKYILHPFIKDDELLSETFLNIADATEISEITGQLFIEMVRKTQWKLWSQYIKDNPRLEEYFRAYRKQYKQNARQSLRNSYIIELIHGKDRRKSDWTIERTGAEMFELIKKKREELRIRRIKTGYLSLEEFT